MFDDSIVLFQNLLSILLCYSTFHDAKEMFEDQGNVWALIDSILVEFDGAPQLHELGLRLLRNFLEHNLTRPSKLIEMKSLHVSRSLDSFQKATMMNNTLLNTKAKLVWRLAGKEAMVYRFIAMQMNFIADLRKSISDLKSDNKDQNNQVSNETMKTICMTLAFLNSYDPSV